MDKIRDAENIVDDLLWGNNNIVDDYTKKIITVEKWHDMVVEMYGENGSDYCDLEELYIGLKKDIKYNFRNNLKEFFEKEQISKVKEQS